MFQWNRHSFTAHTTKCLSGRNKLWLLIKGLQGKKSWKNSGKKILWWENQTPASLLRLQQVLRPRERVIGRGIQFVKLLKEEEQISLLCRAVKLDVQNLRLNSPFLHLVKVWKGERWELVAERQDRTKVPPHWAGTNVRERSCAH